MTNEATPGQVASTDQLGRVAEAKGQTMSDLMNTAALKMQRDSLRDALRELLDARAVEAKSLMRHQSRGNSFCNYSAREILEYEGATLAVSNAECEARVLLLTLRDGA